MFCDANYESDADFRKALNETLYEQTNLQARFDTIPWKLAEDSTWLNSDELALAPSPGPAYAKYYSTIGKYTRRHKQIQRNQRTILRGCKAQPTPCESHVESAVETPECEQANSPNVLTQCSSAYIESRDKQCLGGHDNYIKRFPGTLPEPKILRPVPYVSYSVETLVSIFHPCKEIIALSYLLVFSYRRVFDLR